MMQSLVKKVNSFITFDLPLEKAHITARFSKIHQKCQDDDPGWSTKATRQKLVAEYWYTHVVSHFAVLFALPALIIILLSGSFIPLTQYLSIVFLVGVVCFSILHVLVYRQYFTSFFLPQLETVKEAYENKMDEHLEKCRQAQLSNLALTLIFYVYDKTSSINSLQCNDKFAKLQMKLFGVDQGSLKKNLELILGKKESLRQRQQTEINNRFDEAISYFEEMEFEPGVQILKKLQEKFR